MLTPAAGDWVVVHEAEARGAAAERALVLAAARRLSAPCRRLLEQPLGVQLEKIVNRLLLRWRNPWVRGEQGFRNWTPLMPEVCAACFASDASLAQYLEERFDSRRPSPIDQSLLCLLAVRAPHAAPALLEQLEPEARRALTLRLVRHGWLTALPSALRTPEDDKELRLPLAQALSSGSHNPDAAATVGGLAEALALGELDPCAADSAPHRRLLWALDSETCCTLLAEAFLRALARGGRTSGERALCFWVNGWAKPSLGMEPPQARARLEALKAALSRARNIPSTTLR